MHITLNEAYEVLGIKVGASDAEVKKAYKMRALRTHPDKNPNDPEASKKFLMVSEAYKRITDPSSFHDDEDDQMPTEEEMEEMFNAMFSEMVGGNGMGGVSPQMFAAMEEMMMNGADEEDVIAAMMFGQGGGGMFGDFDSDEEDDDYMDGMGDGELLDMLMQEMMRPDKYRKSKSTKSSKLRMAESKSSKSSKSDKQRKGSLGDGEEDDDSSDCWETDEEEHMQKINLKNKSKSKSKSMSRDDGSSKESGDFDIPFVGTTKSVKFATSGGSRRIPPRVSSGFLSANGTSSSKNNSSRSADSKSAKVRNEAKSENKADADTAYQQDWDSNRDKETELQREKARDKDRDSKATSFSDIVVGDRVLVQDRLVCSLL